MASVCIRVVVELVVFFFSSRRRHTRFDCDWSSDVCSSDLENNGGYQALNIGNSSYGKFDKRIYTDLCSDHPIDLTRYQVANCYMGRVGLIRSGERRVGKEWRSRWAPDS